MKLKEFLKQFDGLDPETEIYQASSEDDDGERILHPELELRQVAVVNCPYHPNTLMIPNEDSVSEGLFDTFENVWVIL